MKAYIFNEFGTLPGHLSISNPMPKVGNHEVLVKISAVSVNPLDVCSGQVKLGRF